MGTSARAIAFASSALLLAVVVLADGPRTALVAGLLAGAIAITRVRYAAIAAIVALGLMAAVCVGGDGPVQDARPQPTRTTHAT